MADSINSEMLARILNAVPEPLFVKDAAHRWIYANQPFWDLLGSSDGSEYLGKSDYDVFPDAEAQVFWDIDDKVITQNEIIQNEETITKPNGEILLAMTKKSPIKLPTGGQGLIGIIHDITLLRETESQLQAAHRLNLEKSNFMATMSHEIRTPLNGVIGMAEMLADSDLSKEQRDQLGVILDSGNALNSIVSSILTLARIQSGRLNLELCETDLRGEITEIVQHYHKQAAAKGLKVRLAIAPELPDHVALDPLRVREAIGQILSNAVKFTHTGEITIIVRAVQSTSGGHTISIQVKDTGIGIETAEQDKMFAPFRQLDGSRERYYGGTGIGLTIARDLARIMGGDVTMLSALGKGSIFTLTFDAARAETLIDDDVDDLWELRRA